MISGTNQDAMVSHDSVVGIVTPIDLFNYVTNTKNAERITANQDNSI
jgi:hypothetical protein